jgi:hypothetical protein
MPFLDNVLWIYICSVVISFCGFGLFVWWWRKIGSATNIYIYVSLLFATNAFSDVLAGYSRYLKRVNIEEYLELNDSGLWIFRRIPELIVLFIFVISMLRRVITMRQRIKNGEVIIVKDKNKEKKNANNS